ncbi:hypothetical protein D3C74_352000 [compost metagenome]
MNGFQAGVTGELLATVCGSGLKRMGRVLRSRYPKGNLHGQRGTVWHTNRCVQAGLSFDERSYAALAFPTARDHRIQLPMAEGFPATNLFRTLRDGLAHSKLAACLCWLLPLPFVSQDGKHAFHQTACIQPAIDGFKTYHRLTLLTQSLYDLLRRPGRLKLFFNATHQFQAPLTSGD